MLRQEQIAGVIDAQASEFTIRGKKILREAVSQVQSLPHFASIITGIRRCGKSTLMAQLKNAQSAGRKSLYLNFDDINLSGFVQEDFTRLGREIEHRGAHTLYFDEVQLVAGWEVFIHHLLRSDYQIYISGSNASMLSSELGTHLTGRHLDFELFPFSYPEYIAYRGQEASEATLREYLHDGGMPEYLSLHNPLILKTVLDDILVRDIAIRYNIRNIDGLRQLAVYLLTNNARLFTGNSLAGIFGAKGASTVLEYVSYMRDAYLFDTVGQYSPSLKAVLRNPRKTYAIDLGMVSAVTLSSSPDLGRQLENFVFLLLRRKYKGHIFYYNDGKGECDFIVTGQDNRPQSAIQVCWQLNSENEGREFGGLQTAMRQLSLSTGYLVTLNQQDQFDVPEGKISVLRAWDAPQLS